MSPAERQQVIDALEASLVHLDRLENELMTAEGQFLAEFAQLNAALAIMRREREREELARWMREHDAGGS